MTVGKYRRSRAGTMSQESEESDRRRGASGVRPDVGHRSASQPVSQPNSQPGSSEVALSPAGDKCQRPRRPEPGQTARGDGAAADRKSRAGRDFRCE